MEKFVNLVNGNFVEGHLPKGYKAKKIKRFSFRAPFKKYLALKTREKKALWKNYVMESEEYDGVSRAERRRIAREPNKELQTKHLLLMGDAFKIYKRGKFIGYHVQLDDFVQAAIYQDGAWYELFLNKNQNFLLNSLAKFGKMQMLLPLII